MLWYASRMWLPCQGCSRSLPTRWGKQLLLFLHQKKHITSNRRCPFPKITMKICLGMGLRLINIQLNHGLPGLFSAQVLFRTRGLWESGWGKTGSVSTKQSWVLRTPQIWRPHTANWIGCRSPRLSWYKIWGLPKLSEEQMAAMGRRVLV